MAPQREVVTIEEPPLARWLFGCSGTGECAFPTEWALAPEAPDDTLEVHTEDDAHASNTQ
ncbi:MAG: hypothetical protein M5T61_15940 [Acidimicrobiia bacterium]|jgi:hypothetical protein|nr:hypothetical protein [Acidimicrobiia bacterium]